MSPVTRSQQSTCHFRLASTDLCRILRQGFRGLPILICTADEFRMARSSLDNWDNPPKDIFFTEFPLKAMQNDDYHKLKFFLIQNVQMIST